MRTAILFGLTFIGSNIGHGLKAQLKGDATPLFVMLLLFCMALDVLELVMKARE